MENLTREKLIELIKKKPLVLRSCSMCRADLIYFYEGDQLFFDPSCGCVTYVEPPIAHPDSKLDYYLEQEGWQKEFQEFYKEELTTPLTNLKTLTKINL